MVTANISMDAASQPDFPAIRRAFEGLARDMADDSSGSSLQESFRSDPLSVLSSRGIDLSPLDKNPEVKSALVELLRTDGGLAAPECGAEPSSVGCWICVKAAETGISIAVGVVAAAALFAGGAIAAAAIATVAPGVALILGIAVAAAVLIIEAILAYVTSIGQLVNELALKACAGACS